MSRRRFLKTGAALAASALPWTRLAAAASAPAVPLTRLGAAEPFDYAQLKGLARSMAASSVQGSQGCAAGADRKARLGPVAGDPFSRRSLALGRRWRMVSGAILPSGVHGHETGASLQRRERTRAGTRLRPGDVRLQQKRRRWSQAGVESRVRGLPAVVPLRLDARCGGLPGGVVLSRRGRRQAVRHVAARVGYRLRHAPAGGVSGLHRLLPGASRH